MSSKTALWLTHAAEIWSADPTDPGATGDFAEVVRGDVRDAGGNVLFSGSADECVAAAGTYRIRVLCVPTEWRRVAGEVAGADHHWRLVTE